MSGTDWFAFVLVLVFTSWIWGPMLIGVIGVIFEGIAYVVKAWRRER